MSGAQEKHKATGGDSSPEIRAEERKMCDRRCDSIGCQWRWEVINESRSHEYGVSYRRYDVVSAV